MTDICATHKFWFRHFSQYASVLRSGRITFSWGQQLQITIDQENPVVSQIFQAQSQGIPQCRIAKHICLASDTATTPEVGTFLASGNSGGHSLPAPTKDTLFKLGQRRGHNIYEGSISLLSVLHLTDMIQSWTSWIMLKRIHSSLRYARDGWHWIWLPLLQRMIPILMSSVYSDWHRVFFCKGKWK